MLSPTNTTPRQPSTKKSYNPDYDTKSLQRERSNDNLMKISPDLKWNKGVSQAELSMIKTSSVSPPRNKDPISVDYSDPTDIPIPPMPHRMKSNATF